MSQEEYQFDEASVQAIMHWAETAQLPKEVVLSESEHIYDTSLYVRAYRKYRNELKHSSWQILVTSDFPLYNRYCTGRIYN